MTISNPRGVKVQLLGELLYVERRLADTVLQALAGSVSDRGLAAALEQHREDTVTHCDRIETAFRRLEVAATSNRVPQFEHLVDHDAQLAESVVPPSLRDLLHAQSALEVEHWEIGRYTTLLAVAPELKELLRPSLASEKSAADALAKAIERIAQDVSRTA